MSKQLHNDYVQFAPPSSRPAPVRSETEPVTPPRDQGDQDDDVALNEDDATALLEAIQEEQRKSNQRQKEAREAEEKVMSEKKRGNLCISRSK